MTAWKAEADLVIVGSGGAALTAAITAAVAGLDVIVLEKAAVLGGTTAVSGGSLWIPCNPFMAAQGVEDTREEALAYLRACAAEQGDDEHIVALVDHGAPMVEFLEAHAEMEFWAWPGEGGATDSRPWHPGAKPGARPLDAGRVHIDVLGEWAARVRLTEQRPRWGNKYEYYAQHLHVKPVAPLPPPPDGYTSGVALVIRLLRAALRHGVVLHTGTPGREVLIEDGRVVGVRAERDGEPWYVRARGGVLLATGGYAVDEDLKRLWLQRPLETTCEVESNTGDGHLMGMAAGAGVAGLGDAWWMPQMPAGRAADGALTYVGSREDRVVPHTLMVNGLGRRFMNESTNYYDACDAFGAKVGGPPRNHPAWFVFDAEARERYSVIAGKFPGGEVPDWMVVADTLRALAAGLELDPAALMETVERFNGFARSGVDSDFARGQNAWDLAWGDPDQRPNAALGTVERAPFYALPVTAGALATRGGLRVDANARVHSALPGAGPIAGLYAAGNCSSGAVAGAYPGPGATIGAAMTFGYLAARDVTQASRSAGTAGDRVASPG